MDSQTNLGARIFAEAVRILSQCCDSFLVADGQTNLGAMIFAEAVMILSQCRDSFLVTTRVFHRP